MDFNVIIVGAGPGGIFTAYELTRRAPEKKEETPVAGA